MAVDPATPAGDAAAGRCAREARNGRPARGARRRPKLGGSTVGGRRRARDRLEAPGARPAKSARREHGRRTGCRQHRLRFYDDPNPIRHAPQSQSLSRSYGSVLPTSLTYIILCG